MPSPRAAFRSTRPLSSRGVTRTRHSDRSIDPRRHFGQHLVIEALDDKSPDFETHAHVPNAPWTDNDVRPVFLQKAQRPEFVSHPQDNRRIIAVWIPEPPVPSQVAAPYAPGHRQVRLMTERYSRTTPRPAPPRPASGVIKAAHERDFKFPENLPHRRAQTTSHGRIEETLLHRPSGMPHSQAAFRPGVYKTVSNGHPKRSATSTQRSRFVSIMILTDKGLPDNSRLDKSKFDNVISQ